MISTRQRDYAMSRLKDHSPEVHRFLHDRFTAKIRAAGNRTSGRYYESKRMRTTLETLRYMLAADHDAQETGFYRDFILDRCIKAHEDVDGMVTVKVWQLDCDCASGTSIYQIKPNVEAWDELLDMLYEGAEGQVIPTLLTPQEASYFRPESHDHALEAHENGNPYAVNPYTY